MVPRMGSLLILLKQEEWQCKYDEKRRNKLYLSCSNCNTKLSDRAISVEYTLDICRDSDEVIQDNITFEDVIINNQRNHGKEF